MFMSALIYAGIFLIITLPFRIFGAFRKGQKEIAIRNIFIWGTMVLTLILLEISKLIDIEEYLFFW
ncbi:hypothetical protein [Atribacter laminatus]|jgi:hypothetical protein|uniref:Uncharacterized protein n=1 Tax=Atribacter laminatus TaxID=2847778 RepID=A0A7T1F2U1_ATRLM|nr:hypothetical protein [Atribacter laminatus]QPM68085.1 hypothetical protein RT761_01299 [Atribacter laminatus]